MHLGYEQAGQWIVNMRSAAVMLKTIHTNKADELAEMLCDMAEEIEGQ